MKPIDACLPLMKSLYPCVKYVVKVSKELEIISKAVFIFIRCNNNKIISSDIRPNMTEIREIDIRIFFKTQNYRDTVQNRKKLCIYLKKQLYKNIILHT